METQEEFEFGEIIDKVVGSIDWDNTAIEYSGDGTYLIPFQYLEYTLFIKVKG